MAQPPRQPRVPASVPPGRQSNWNSAPNSSAPQRAAQNTPTILSSTGEDLNLTLALHTLAVVQNKAPILRTTDPRGNNLRAEALGSIFPTKSAQDKFIDVLQALIAICTALPGPDNVAAMLACGPEHRTIKIYLCQNSGLHFEALRTHLERVWELLRGMRPLSLAEDEITPPRKADDLNKDFIKELATLAHTFVFKKVLKRLTSKLDRVRVFNKIAEANSTISAKQKQLLWCYLSTTEAAKLVDPAKDLETQPSWRALRVCITDLYHLTKKPSYTDDVQGLQNIIPPDSYLDLDKSIKKAIKIDVAVIALSNLARSSKRGWVVNCDLQVQNVPLPMETTLQIPFKTFRTLRPANQTTSEFYSMLTHRAWNKEDADETIVKVDQKVHSECQLAAALFDNEGLLAEPPLIPYISCSKLHCVFSYRWMRAFNDVSNRILGFDGTHGTVRRGWHPPTLQDSVQHALVVERLKCDVISLISAHSSGHQKETSDSSTSSIPTASELPPFTDQRRRARDEMTRRIVALHSMAPPLPVRLSSPPTATIPAVIPSPSIAPVTPQALPRSWANLAATNSQRWGSTAKHTAPGTTEVLESTQSVPQPPAASTSGPDLNVPQSSPHPELTDPRCFVGGVSKDITEAMLSSTMQRYGTLKHINIIRTKNIAFVEFTELEGARQAISASTTSYGVWLDKPQGGRVRLTIEKPKGRQDSSGRGEGRGGRGRGGAMRSGGAATPGGR